ASSAGTRPTGPPDASPWPPNEVSERLQQRFRFYFWDEAAGVVRWMCAFDTTEDDVDRFLAALKEEMAG
ncbi:hypothetical protein ACWDAZ_29325, partial [Streptomyces sp. NPDC001215]